MNSVKQQRNDVILAQAYKYGHVLVRSLAETLNASTATIRRDLHDLAAQGFLELTHGGAKVVRSADYSFLSKSIRNVEAKKTIARLAADMVHDGDQIFLDSGTTCFEMTAHLRTRRSLCIIVNSIRTAGELQIPGLNVIIIGGQYRPDRMDTVGPMAYQNLDNLRGFKAFLGSDGISLSFGLTSVDIESAHIVNLASSHARQNILLVDSSKFDQPALHKITDFNLISTIVTEKQPSKEWYEFAQEKNIDIIYPQ